MIFRGLWLNIKIPSLFFCKDWLKMIILFDYFATNLDSEFGVEQKSEWFLSRQYFSLRQSQSFEVKSSWNSIEETIRRVSAEMIDRQENRCIPLNQHFETEWANVKIEHMLNGKKKKRMLAWQKVLFFSFYFRWWQSENMQVHRAYFDCLVRASAHISLSRTKFTALSCCIGRSVGWFEVSVSSNSSTTTVSPLDRHTVYINTKPVLLKYGSHLPKLPQK